LGTVDAITGSEVITVKVAVAEWQRRVSPVFDTARSVIVVGVDARGETARTRIALDRGSLHDRVNALTAGGVDVLLCGAVSRPLYEMLECAGIDVTPFLSGTVEELLEAFIAGRISDPQYTMPGCCHRRRRRRSKWTNRTTKGKEAT
jgi:predicted Fe-Mo cluster-binding NifX family protein